MSVTVHDVSKNVWIVDIDTRVYRAEYVDDSEVFPLDRWRVRNAHRRQYLPWDSPTLSKVVYAVKRHVWAEKALQYPQEMAR